MLQHPNPDRLAAQANLLPLSPGQGRWTQRLAAVRGGGWRWLAHPESRSQRVTSLVAALVALVLVTGLAAAWGGAPFGKTPRAMGPIAYAARAAGGAAASGGCDNRLTNPEFNYGINDWEFISTAPASASFSIDNTSRLSGANSGRVSISAISGSNWHVQLAHSMQVLEAGRTYRVTFQARAAGSRTMYAYVRQYNSPYANYGGAMVNLTTAAQTYSYQFTASVSETRQAAVVFDLGASTHDVWIDDVRFEQVCDPVECVGGAYSSKTGNPEFDYGTSRWDLYVQSGNTAALTIDGSGQLAGANSARVNITQTTGTIWHVQLVQPGHTITAGQTYRLRFRARASSARAMYVALQLQPPPHTEFAGQTVSLTTAATVYTLLFTPQASNDLNVGVYFNLAQLTGSVWLDAVEFAPVCSATPVAENAEVCGNGIDDDGDGYIDAFDPDCFGCSTVVVGLQAGTLLAGTDRRPGAVYSYPGAMNGVDVRIQIDAFSHSDIEIANIDWDAQSNGGYNLAFQPEVDYNWRNPDGTTDPPGERYVQFTFAFYEVGTTIPKEVEEFSLSAIDVDGDSRSVREFIESSGFSGYSTGIPSNLTLSGSLKAKSSANVAPGVDETATPHIIGYKYSRRTSVTIRYGAEWDGSYLTPGESRLNSIYFKCFDLPESVVCPFTAVSGPSSVCRGEVLTLRASTANTAGTCSYTWQHSSDNGTWATIPGATRSSLSVNAHTADRYYRFSATCSGNATCGPMWSPGHLVQSINCGEVCDNGIDDDGDGLVDCRDPACQAATKSATVVFQSNGIPNPDEALGAPNGEGASVYDKADTLVLSLGSTIGAGQAYTLTWRRRPAPYPAGTSRVRVFESLDQSSWTQQSVRPSTSNQTGFSSVTLTAGVPTRYLRFVLDDGLDDDFDLDAVTYTNVCPPETCANGADDDADGLPDGLDPSCCASTTLVPQSQYTLHSVDSEELVDEYAPATAAFDGDPDTYWHTTWGASSAPMPHEIVIDLGSERMLSGLRLLPRQHDANGRIAAYEIYASPTPGAWGPAVATGTWTSTPLRHVVLFGNKSARYLRLRALSSVNGNAWASVAELDAIVCNGPPAESCANGFDDDGDGFVDCADEDCPNAPVVGRVSQ